MKSSRVLIAAALIALPLAVAPDAPALPETVQRVAGVNRYATAVALSQEQYPESTARVVFVATGENFPDALAAGAAASDPELSGPVLLVTRDELPAVTADEIRRLAPEAIVLVGGTAAISDAVEAQLRPLAETVRRVAGVNRYETAAMLGYEGDRGGTLFVTGATTFHDALLAAPLAGAASGAVLLTSPTELPAETAEVLRTMEPARVYVIGTPEEVPNAQIEEMRGLVPGSVERLPEGEDVYERSVFASSYHFTSAGSAILATSATYADALAAGPLAAMRGIPLLFSEPTCVPPPVDEEVTRLDASAVILAGGTAALSDDVARGVLCGSSTPTPPPSSGSAIEGYVTYTDLDAEPWSGITATRNSTGRHSENSVRTLGSGRYEVRFPGMATTGGVPHVTTAAEYGNPGYESTCAVEEWGPDGADLIVVLACEWNGGDADPLFSLLFTHWTGTSSRAYAFVQAASGTPAVVSSNTYNGSGGAVTTRRAYGVGSFRVDFAGHAWPGHFGTAKATAVGMRGTVCNAAAWQRYEAGAFAIVQCNNDDGPVDSDFTLTWAADASIGPTVGAAAYGQTGPIPGPGQWTSPAGTAYISSGGGMRYTKLDVGRFTVTVDNLDGTQASLHASPYTPEHVRCIVGVAWREGTDTVFPVACINDDGTPVDEPFSWQMAG